MRLQYFCIQYWDNKSISAGQIFENHELCMHFGLEMSHYIVGVKDFRLECFLLSCISKLIYPCYVILYRSIQMVSFAKIRCWSFLEYTIYCSFESVDVFRIFQFVLVLVG